MQIFLDEVRITGIRTHVSDYAYTNEHEFFAVLAEYFFTSPDLLNRRDPALYTLLRDLFHQDTEALLPSLPWRRRGLSRNAPCPCGSGRKYKHCCLKKTGTNGRSTGTTESTAGTQR